MGRRVRGPCFQRPFPGTPMEASGPPCPSRGRSHPSSPPTGLLGRGSLVGRQGGQSLQEGTLPSIHGDTAPPFLRGA